ncbi:CXXX repeat peptide modification system protein [Clostridium botulinum]|nr:CXXX repeat peptide modification system protein [Clostridium botulinum]NFD33989.1 CXXX repeat peptide modification system protein [Clostridium botulinum]NFD59095.1 CXXX repeat peptide modification system protein [Clostridium botulinum]NFE02380.1 CXXX repeat peptide modification system protein [Clostridium botulinum]
MKREILASITEEERNEIMNQFENINSLKSLLITLTESQLDIDKNNWFYNKLRSDFSNATKSYNLWWTNISKKYNLNYATSKLGVDFDKQVIYCDA